MPVRARTLVRKMRGGAQAHLLEADDGNFWVVKFRNNPQHRRILVNEFLASSFLQYLQIAAPETTLVQITPDFLEANPDVHIQLGPRREAIEPGWHFGSKFPGDPGRTAVYDFLPDALLDQVENLGQFPGMLVVDKWLSNADSRQSIFVRAKVKEYIPTALGHRARLGFVALMMDHGFCFDGPYWRFSESPIQGLYFRPSVYQSVRGFDAFQPWLEQVTHFPEHILDDAMKRIPPEWLDGDEQALEDLLTRLLARRRKLPELLKDCRRGRNDPFPNWKE